MSIPIITFSIYFASLLLFGVLFAKRQTSDKDYILGDRSLNFWLTALSAHASDMSSWLFLAYPGLIFVGGLFNVWAAIGLTGCMFLLWQFIAPRIRHVTEETNSLTLSAYFENRLMDKSGLLRIVSAVFSLLFYTVYISSGLVSLGFLADTLFGVNYFLGILIGLAIVVIYVFLGGYKSIAWIDLFQGIFLLGVIIYIPFLLFAQIGDYSAIASKKTTQIMSLFPNYSPSTFFHIITLAGGWGLGYFGQPHIITKFMGIKNVTDMNKSKLVGLSWQILALCGATALGLIGIYFFPNGLTNPELVILQVVQSSLTPFFAALILCAILAATTNVMAAQILVVASSMSEDFYKRLVKREASSKELLWVSKISVVIISLIALCIAVFNTSSIYNLVLYAWAGLGSSFGPLILFSLYSTKITSQGGLAGVIVGALIGVVWPLINSYLSTSIPSLFPGFLLSSFTIFLVSYMTKEKYIYEE